MKKLNRKFIEKIAVLILVVTYIAVFSFTDISSEEKKQVKKIEFEDGFTTLRLGEKKTLHLSYVPKKASKKDLRFKSMDEKALSVSKKGVIKAKKEGVGKKVKVVAYLKEDSKIRDRIWIRILPEIDKKKPMVALTFDDGPNAPTTNRIVTTLKKNGAVGTFFEIGENLGKPENQKAVKRAYELGNEIGSHTLNHKCLTKLSSSEVKAQNNGCCKLLEKITGMKVTLMRPPYGSFSEETKKAVDMPMIMWSVDTLDWQTLDAEKTYRSAMTVKDGGIVLMHSIYSQTADAVDKIVPALKKKGFQCVTVSELFRYKKKTLKKGRRYNNA